MRYVRFLKTPRLVSGQKPSDPEISFLITITSDLGDSFLPYDVALNVELLPELGGPTISSKKVTWGAGMRTLKVAVPLRTKAKDSIIVRVGTEPKTSKDRFESLLQAGSHGIVSAFSSPVDPKGHKEARKLVERRIALSGPKDVPEIRIWEETGESIARHLWDAGIAVSSYLVNSLSQPDMSPIAKASFLETKAKPSRILELGTGCGMVSMALAQVIENADFILTDLSEAEEIVSCNLENLKTARSTSAHFLELDWETDLPEPLRQTPVNAVLAADCTYNPDSSPALVNTISRLARVSPGIAVIIAMKFRHASEEVFFDLMNEAKFKKACEVEIPLPGDEEPGEEIVHIYLFRHESFESLTSEETKTGRRRGNSMGAIPAPKKRKGNTDR